MDVPAAIAVAILTPDAYHRGSRSACARVITLLFHAATRQPERVQGDTIGVWRGYHE